MDRIGKYDIKQKLGEGATSTVYLGYDSFAGRDVAVKVIYPEVLKDREKGQLYRHLLVNEASLAGKLQISRLAMYLSMTAFFLYVTTKVLEARKWS